MVIVGIIIQIHSDNVHIFSHYLYYQRTCNKLTITFFSGIFFPVWRFLLVLLKIGGRGCESFTPFELSYWLRAWLNIFTSLRSFGLVIFLLITPTHPPSFESCFLESISMDGNPVDSDAAWRSFVHLRSCITVIKIWNCKLFLISAITLHAGQNALWVFVTGFSSIY